MATTFDIVGRVNAIVSSSSLSMLRKLQTELRATANALMKMGENQAANAMGHTAMALDRVAGATEKAAAGVKKVATTTSAATKAVDKLKTAAEQQDTITKKLSKSWKFGGGELQGLSKAVGLLGKKYTYSTNAQKEWVPALKSTLNEINKQKVAMVASGRAITAGVTGQELFIRTNQVLASGLHKVSGKFTDYDNSMAKSLGRSPAFRSEVNKIAGAVGKQGEAFKNQFAALTKVDNVWRDHVTTLHKAGTVTTSQATKMYDAYSHLGLSAKELQARIKASNGELINAATYNKAARGELEQHTKSMAVLNKAEAKLAALSGKSIGAIQKETEASMKRTRSLEAVTAGIDKQVAAYKNMDKHQAKVVKGEQSLAKATGARIGKIQEITTRMRAQGASYADIGKHLDTLKAKHAANTTQMGKVAKASDSLRKSNKQLAGEIDALGRIRVKNLAATQASVKSLEGLARKYPQLSKQVAVLSQKVAAGNMPLASADKILHKLRSGMGQTTTKASLLGRAMSSLVSHLKSFASYAAAATIIGGIAAMFGSAINAVIKYDQALHDLQAITRATDTEVGLMGEKIREIGRSTKFSASEVAVAMRTLGQAGFTAQEAIKSIGDVANLATGTLTSMKVVVDLVTTAIRAFDMQATEMGRVTDVFANAVNRSKLTIDKLRIAFNYIGPIAAKAGITFEETNAAMMMLSNAGIRASTSGTGFRRTIQQLLKPTKEFRAAIEAAGYTVDDFNPQMNDMRDIVRRLAEVIPDAESAFRMFSLRSSAVVAAFSSQGVSSFDALHSAVLRTGSASEMAEKQIEGLGITFKQAWDKAQDLALAFGEAGVSGALKALGKSLQMVFDGLRIFVSSGIGKTTLAVGSLTVGIYALKKVWALIKMSSWASAVMGFAVSMWGAAAAGEALNAVGRKLNMTFVYLAVAVAVAYGAYKIYNSVLAGMSKVNTRYIDDLDKIHREELERLENIKRLVSIARDEMETNRGRSKALIELSKEGAKLNLVLNEEIGEVEDLTGTILDNKDALDKWALAFDDYSEKAKIENLEAQVRLFEETEEAIKRTTSSMTYWSKMSKKFASETAQGLAKLPILGGLVSGAFLLMRKRVDACREANEALESQQGEAYERMVTAVTSFGVVTQEVWKKYMLQAGASEEAVAELFTDSEERITRAHLEAYMKIQLARENMTEAERLELEKHLDLVGTLFGKIHSTTDRLLEKDLAAVREHYSEREKETAEFYASESNRLRGRLGLESGIYEALLDLASSFGAAKLALLKQQHEEERILIEGRDLGMVKEQEKLAENDKKYANRKLALEKDIAEKLRTLAEEQLELLASAYKESAAAFDENVSQRVASIDRYYAYEKTKAELQITDAEALAERLVELETQRFDDLWELGERATEDRLASEERYHEESLRAIETAREAAKDQFEEGCEDRLTAEKDLNVKLVEIDRTSMETRIEILKGWSAVLSERYTEAVENTRRYANKIISIENEIKEIRKRAAEDIVSVNESTQNKILRIYRAGMTEKQLIISKIREAHNKLAEADRLAAIGTEEALTQAVGLYGEVQNIYTELGTKAASAAKEGKGIGITHGEAAKEVSDAGGKIVTALELIKTKSIEAKEAEITVAKQAQKSWSDLAKDIKIRIGDIQTDISHLTGKVDNLVSSIDSLEDKEVTVKADEVKLNTSIGLVDKLWTNICKLKDKTIVITTKHVTEHVEAAQAGGPIGMFARGGKLPGFGGGDKVSALLEAGEFVVNKDAVRKYGTAMFAAYNNMAAPVISAISNPLKFAFGGFVGKPKIRASSTGTLGVGDFSQLNKAITRLSRTIDTLNKASSALGSESVLGEDGKDRPMSLDEYDIQLPNNLKNLVGDLRRDLKEIRGKDKNTIEEVIELLAPSGVTKEEIMGRLGNRKLPNAEDVGGVVLNLEEQRAELIQKQEELVIFREDLKKIQEFIGVIRGVIGGASELTATADPYVLRSNEPDEDFKKIIADAKVHLAGAVPLLSTSIFDLSEIRSKTEAYLDAQYELADKQRKNMVTVGTMTFKTTDGLTTGSTFGRSTVKRFCTPEWIERWSGVKCAKSEPYIQNPDFTLSNSRLCAKSWEADLLAKSKALEFGFDSLLGGAALELGNKKKEILRGKTDKHEVQESLFSLAKSSRKEFDYKPIEVPDDSAVQDAWGALQKEQEKVEPSPSMAVELKNKYQKLAASFFAKLPKFATGGFVDSILARLSPGEFVLRAEAVNQLGVPFLNTLNNFKFPIPAFAQGGLVESPTTAATSISSAQTRDIHLSVNITGAGEITEKQVRKWVLPAVDKIRRLER